MTSPPITATPDRTVGCLACALNLGPHRHGTDTVPLAARTAVTAPARTAAAR